MKSFINHIIMIIFADIRQYFYICSVKIMGCLKLQAEIIPSVPDADNAAVGKRDLILLIFVNIKSKENEEIFIKLFTLIPYHP